jgi:glycosyltransferase involved in cell wall biosynthesis
LIAVRFVYHHRTQGRGAEGTHIAEIVRGLRAAGHAVTLLSPPGIDPLRTAGSEPVDKSATRERGVHRLWKAISRHAPQVAFELLELGYNLQALPRLLLALRRAPGAVLYERYAFFLFAGVLAARLLGRPVILEVNEVAGIPRARPQRLVGPCRRIERWVFSRADAVLAVSSFLAEGAIRQGARADAVRVVPNAVRASWLERAPAPERVRVERRLNGATVLGFLGWFDAWDRLELLVQAVRDLAGRHPGLRLMLVGDGPARPELSRLAREWGLEERVILTGPVAREAVPDYIAAMDICVLADSNVFGSPIVLFEFMGLGRTVIAPDRLPIRDVLRDGTNGCIVPPGDLAALEATISRLAADPELRSRLGREARRSVEARHTWERNAGVVAEVAGRERRG